MSTKSTPHAGVEQRLLTWSEFLEQALPEARALIKDNSPAGIDAYLAGIAALVCRTNLESVPEPAQFSAYPGYPDDVRFAMTHRGSPFIALQFWIEPGALMPVHPHPGGSACTVLLEGSARVRNFEFAEEPDRDKKGDVLLRETREELLVPGRINLIGNPRNNIHGFRAGPEGARGLDITTSNIPSLSSKDSIFEVAKEPRDPDRRTFEAHWHDK